MRTNEKVASSQQYILNAYKSVCSPPRPFYCRDEKARNRKPRASHAPTSFLDAAHAGVPALAATLPRRLARIALHEMPRECAVYPRRSSDLS